MTSAISKNAASQANSNGAGKPIDAMYSAVAFMSANLNPAAIANTPAKISLATRIAAVFMAHSLYFGADQTECRALGIDGVYGIFAADRKGVVKGKSVSVGVDSGGC